MIAEANIIEHVYQPRGGADELCDCREPEVLMDGPAGTGKSRAWLEVMVRDAAAYPGSRQAIVRKTRVSLTDSGLKTFENKVLSDGMDEYYLSQSLANGPSTATRHAYHFRNGSEIVCHGMDNPTRLFSTEYDRIYVQEATELTENEWESLHRALRNGVMPFQQLGGDCNPDAETHWLNKRCLKGQTKRIQSKHEDNPSLDESYLNRLRALTGVRRARLYEGRWVAAEGQVWDNFLHSTHVLSVLPPWIPIDEKQQPKWRMVVGDCDWGFRNAGVLHVWGVDNDGRMYLLREVYRAGMLIDWWTNTALDLQKEYKVESWQCDPAEPGNITQFRRAGVIATEADNDLTPGLDAVRDRLEVQRDGRARMYFMAGALRERCRICDEAKRACGVVEEIPAYVWRIAEDGKPIKEEPDPACSDHGCDGTRYSTRYVDRFFTASPPPKKSVKRLAGYILGHPPEHYE